MSQVGSCIAHVMPCGRDATAGPSLCIPHGYPKSEGARGERGGRGWRPGGWQWPQIPGRALCTHALSRPAVFAQREPAFPAGGDTQHPRDPPSSVPACQGVSRLFGVLLRASEQELCACWCSTVLGRPALRHAPRCGCHRRSLPPRVPTASRGTETHPSAPVFQNQGLTGSLARPGPHGRGTAGHQHPLEMSQRPHTSPAPS